MNKQFNSNNLIICKKKSKWLKSFGLINWGYLYYGFKQK